MIALLRRLFGLSTQSTIDAAIELADSASALFTSARDQLELSSAALADEAVALQEAAGTLLEEVDRAWAEVNRNSALVDRLLDFTR